MSRTCWLPEYTLILFHRGITFYLLLIIPNAIQINGLNDFDYHNKIPSDASKSSSGSSYSTVSPHGTVIQAVPAKTEMSHPSDNHHLVKRMDLELCLGQFDVHKDTIIRTAESQAIGGIYLQGLELSTPVECQRLCCETDGCDVYVFEEKHSGYCYLFKCGPSDNFHCKFTRHANYTSAVLMPLHQLAGTTSTTPTTTTVATTTTTTTHRPRQAVSYNANISQQEKELTSLKLKEASDVDGISVGSVKSGFDSGLNSKIFSENDLIGSSPIINNPLGIQKAVIHNTTILCGRFQFACHSGECIAVYNACDGIPQCEDGSDEGPECSGAAALANVTPTKSYSGINAQAVDASKQRLTGVQSQRQADRIQSPASLVNNREDANVWISRKTVVANQPNRFGNLSTINRQIFNYHEGINQLSANAMSFHTNVNQTYPAYTDHEANSIAFLQNVLPSYKTFNTIPENQEFQQNQVHADAMPPDINLPPSNYLQQLQSNLANTVKSESHLMIPAPHQSNPKQNINIPSIQPHELGPQISLNSVSNPDEMPQHESHLSNLNFSQTKPLEDKVQDLEKQFPETEKQPIGREKAISAESILSRSKDPLELGLLQQLQHPASPSPVQDQNQITHGKLVMEFRQHDGFSDRPGGAVLSLILGLIITVALAVLIGCRLRKVRRRSRRLGGKTSYSHDADFLVNGMYL